jgi:hypothetical protein
MKFTIDEKVSLKHKLTIPEVLAALSVRQAKNYEEMMENLFNREILVQKGDKTLITQHWSDVLDEVICDSSGSYGSDDRLLNLAIEMRECFPKGKMRDRFGRETPYYYRCNNNEVIKKLKKFFAQFGNYPDEEIIDATKRYVAANSRNNYANMRLIKYFILKDALKQGEDGNDHVEQISDLATFLENKEEESTKMTSISDDWLMSSRN